jgi:hypothetical protein
MKSVVTKKRRRASGKASQPRSDFEVGSFLASDLVQLGNWIAEFEKDFREISQGISDPAKPFRELLDRHGRYWWVFYEVPIENVVAVMAVVQGWSDELVGISKKQNPKRALFAHARAEALKPDPYQLADLSAERQCLLINLLISLAMTGRSMQIFGLSMHELLLQAGNGGRAALVKAASIDRSVLFTTVGTQILATAMLANDKRFLRRSFEVTEPPKKRRVNRQARFVARVLREDADGKAAPPITGEQLVELFCQRLQVYAYSSDAAKSLREFLRRAKAEATT